MLLLDECNIAPKEVSGIPDEFLARRQIIAGCSTTLPDGRVVAADGIVYPSRAAWNAEFARRSGVAAGQIGNNVNQMAALQEQQRHDAAMERAAVIQALSHPSPTPTVINIYNY